MSQYLKISSVTGGSYNGGLKDSIIYIGKRYGKQANKKKYTKKEYFKCGIKIIAKPFGRFCKTAILCMVEPKKIKKSNNKQWCYHKRIYGRAYGYIIKLLFKSPPSDKVYVKELLNSLYQDVCKNTELGSELARLCSNALIFWQKDMLELYKISTNISGDDRGDAEKILKKVAEFDKPIP